MSGLNDTIRRLKAFRGLAAGASPAEPGESRIEPFSDFGSNPGELGAHVHVPEGLPGGAPLVVVLHGCTQQAHGYDAGAGWSAAADRHGFAALFPEQKRSNNPNLCFNWFNPQDIRRGSGEALSIRQMIAAVQARHGAVSGPVFVTGLSAGGAMAAVLLAIYPEIFAGGAVIAGLPYGTATSVPEAFERMRSRSGHSPEELAQLVRSASSHRGRWPTLSIWHGTSDATVDPSNAAALAGQWRVLHGLPAGPTRTETAAGYTRMVWSAAGGKAMIEEYAITGMGHGTPLCPRFEPGENAGPFLIDAAISSTERTIAFWGIAGQRAVTADQPRHAAANDETDTGEPVGAVQTKARSAARSDPGGVQKTIEDALRAAGLMR